MENAQKNIIALLIGTSMILFLTLTTASAGDFDDSEVFNITQPNWFNNDPFYNLADALDNARQENKKGLMVLFVTQGCSYCKMFIKKSLSNPDIAHLVQKNFDAVSLEIFDDREMITPDSKNMSIKEFAKQERAEFSPTLAFYGENGQRLFKTTGYQSPERFQIILDYLSGNHYQTEPLRKHLEHSQKVAVTYRTQVYPHLYSDSLFTNAEQVMHRSHFPAKKPMLVFFEKTGCHECNNFQLEVMADRKIRKILEKFDVVRLDASDYDTAIRIPNGRRITPGLWYENLSFSRLPALMFYDEKGNKVLETDALVLRQRMENSLNYVLERAYNKGWTYQRFARSKGIERAVLKTQAGKN